ncbi:MAG: phosphotransferase [Lapillicoccus sp.]
MPREPADLTAEEVGAIVREHWDDGVVAATFVPLGDDAAHWVCAGKHRPRWFVTADDVTADGRLEELFDAYAAARELAARGHHVVVPTVPPGSGAGEAVGVVHGGLLLTVTGYLEGEPGPGDYADDNQRALIAGALGALHADRPPVRTPLWRPGPRSWGAVAQALESPVAWRSGPFGGPVRAALREHASTLQGLHRRYAALAAQALEGRDQWVLTHGRPHTGNVLWLAGGPVLVDWESLRVAPRERDLRTVLRGAQGVEPLSAYTAHGGRADLDDDLVELFDLDEWLGAVARAAARLAGPHAGDGDDEGVRAALLEELAAR